MNGRAEVERQKQRLDATFSRARYIDSNPELLSDLARYLCVLVSAFLEQSVRELVLEHTRKNASPTVQRYVESQLWSFTNAKAQRLIDLLGTLDTDWRRDLEAFLIDEQKDAVDSVVDLRNAISHGRFVGLTMTRISIYYAQIKRVVDHIAGICDPQ